MVQAVRLLFIGLSFSLLQACTEAVPEITDLSSQSGVTANLSLFPSGASNEIVFYGAVGGANITDYRYKYGTASSVDCLDPLGYSAPMPVATPPYIDLTSVADDDIEVCVIGTDGLVWQALENASIASWTKDTLAPTVMLASAVISPTNVYPIPVTITLSEPVVGFTVSDITTINAGLSSFTKVNDTTYTVNVLPANGSTSMGLPAGIMQDLAGNINASSVDLSWTFDGVGPSVLSVSIPASDGSYGSSTYFPIYVTFDEAVNVTGVPYIMVEAGTTDRQADYVMGSGTNTLIFGYTVSGSDYNTDLDLVAGSSLFMSGATITDAVGNSASSVLPIGPATPNSISFSQNIAVIGNPASLDISDSPTYDFGVVATGGLAEYTFVVTNMGGVTATGISGAGIASPFVYKGGTYPGTGGTCGPSLNVGASCTTVVVFSPIAVGLATDTIILNYDNGLVATSADRPIQGTGASPALLTISDAPTYDFGSTPAAGAGVTHVFTLNNMGGVSATGIAEVSMGAPFIFNGGATYPGNGGTCTGTLAAGASCTVVVSFVPDIIYSNFASDLTFDYNDGATISTVARALMGTGSAEVLPVYGTVMGDNYSAWNKYIRYDNDNGGTNANNQDLELCDGSETGSYGEVGGCIHSGEKRKVIFHGKTSCAFLSITDSLNAFDWQCDASSGTATFYTIGLKTGRGLRDLLQTTPTVDWATNSVTLFDNAAFVGSSADSAWWSNSMLELSSVSATTTVNIEIPGVIYYAKNSVNISRLMLRGAGNWGLVTLSGAEIISNAVSSTNWCDVPNGGDGLPDSDPMICSDGGSLTPMFGWIEVDMSGAGVKKSGLIARHWKSMRVHSTHLRTFNVAGGSYSSGAMAMIDGVGNMISGLESFRLNGGVKLYDSTNNTFKKLDLIRSQANDPGGETVIGLYGVSNYNRFYETTIAASANTSSGTVYGVTVEGQHNNFAGLKVSNIQTSGGGTGIVLGGGAHNNVFTEVILSGFNDALFVAGAQNNIFAFSTITGSLNNSTNLSGTASGNTFLSLASVNNFTSLMTDITTAPIANRFINSAFSTLTTPGTGYMFWSNASGNNNVNFQGYVLRNSDDLCDGNESNLSAFCIASGATDVPIGFTQWENSTFIGSISVDDAYNTYDSAGMVGLEATINNATGWMVFESPFRFWGRNYFFGASSRGPANTGSAARIWDFSPKTSGTLANRSYNGTTTNSTMTYTGTTCAANTVDSVKVTHIFGSGSVSFLKNAIEINTDYIGNNNGLCEDGESCTYAPHIGGAQGYGALTANYCTVSGGIKIYGRSTY